MRCDTTAYPLRASYALLVLASLLVVGCVTHGAVGQKLPAISLDVLTGEGENLTAADLTGHVTLLNFWGTWCGPCVQEFPHMVALHNEFKDNANFKLVSVSMYAPGQPRNVTALRSNTQKFLKARSAELTTYVDSQQTTWRGVVNALDGQNGVPTTLILDRTGTIRGVWIGYVSGVERDMQKLIKALLQEG